MAPSKGPATVPSESLSSVLAAVDAAHHELLQLAQAQRNMWETSLERTLTRITRQGGGKADDVFTKLPAVAQVRPRVLSEADGDPHDLPEEQDSSYQLAFDYEEDAEDANKSSVSTTKPRLIASSTMAHMLKDADIDRDIDRRRLVRSRIDFLAGVLVLLNGVLMLVEFELEGRQNGPAVGFGQEAGRTEFEPALSVFRVIDICFVLIFVVEWIWRLANDRYEFHRDFTNWFDTVLVFAGLVEVCLSTLDEASSASRSIVLLRMMRVLKSLRAVRMVRSLRFFRGLRLLVKACQCFLPSLCWAMVLLGIMMTMGALLLGNLLQNFITDETMDLEDRKWIWERYGTAYRASYTLFEITFAGSWPTLTRPVMKKVSEAFVIFFTLYITVVVFAVIRVIGAVFLKDTLEAAQNDAEQLVIDRLRMKQQFISKLEGIFHSIDEHRDGLITEERLTAILAIPRVEAYFQTMDLDVREGQALFHLIDNGDGEVTLEEFIDGIMRCKGPARAIDQVALHGEVRQLDNKVTKVLKWISKVSKHGFHEEAFRIRSSAVSEISGASSLATSGHQSQSPGR